MTHAFLYWYGAVQVYTVLHPSADIKAYWTSAQPVSLHGISLLWLISSFEWAGVDLQIVVKLAKYKYKNLSNTTTTSPLCCMETFIFINIYFTLESLYKTEAWWVLNLPHFRRPGNQKSRHPPIYHEIEGKARYHLKTRILSVISTEPVRWVFRCCLLSWIEQKLAKLLFI